MVIALLFQKLDVGPLFHNLAVPHHQDQICLADGGQAVGNEEGRAVPQQVVDGLLDILLGLGVDGGADVKILHPGPMNRGLEISDKVADSPNCLVLDQVAAGVAVRMAILYLLANRNEVGEKC